MLNQDLARCRPHPSKRISDAVSGDPEVINLTVGEPGYGPPASLLDYVAERVHLRQKDPSPRYNCYAHSRGLPELRQAISVYYQRLYGLEVDPGLQLIVTHGAAEAIWLSVFALTNPGDEVVIADPSYMLYEPIVISLGRTPVRIATRPEEGFRLRPDAVAARLTSRTRLILINSPENPTGTFYGREHLEGLVQLVVERGLYLAHDEVFDRLLFEGEHVPVLSLAPSSNRLLLLNSCSKRFGMTGWRLGWLAGPPEVVEAAAKAHTFMSLATNALIQEATAQVMNDPAVDAEVECHCRALYEKSRRFLDKMLSVPGFSLPFVPPSGGFYLFLGVQGIAERIGFSPCSGSVSEAVAEFLLRKAKVAVVPGTGFGASGEGYVRISFAAPESQLDEAVEKLRRVPELAH